MMHIFLVLSFFGELHWVGGGGMHTHIWSYFCSSSEVATFGLSVVVVCSKAREKAEKGEGEGKIDGT